MFIHPYIFMENVDGLSTYYVEYILIIAMEVYEQTKTSSEFIILSSVVCVSEVELFLCVS